MLLRRKLAGFSHNFVYLIFKIDRYFDAWSERITVRKEKQLANERTNDA